MQPHRGPVNNEEFYNILGVPKDASDADIKKAYRKLALKNHPDKGGDPEKFREISTAYEVLGDSEKKQRYDQFGKDGIDQNSMHNPNDIFSQFFGGGAGRPDNGPQKGEDIRHPLKVSLADLYNGKKCNLAIHRHRKCDECNGVGGKHGCEKHCGNCNGRGIQVQMRQIGPGMVQQIQSHCQACGATGKLIAEEDKCQKCKGRKVNKDRKVLEVYIERGMRNNQTIIFPGESDEKPPNGMPGDIVFILQEKEDDVFRRRGHDLLIKKTLTLSEALCGFCFTFTHLDGRVIKCQSKPGEITKPDDVRVIHGEGMPHHGNPFTKGRLFISFKVAFPESQSLLPEVISGLETLLPAKPITEFTGEEEDVGLDVFDAAQLQREASVQEQGQEDRGPPNGQHVQCQNM
jgi:DnaJ family protein A protein 2